VVVGVGELGVGVGVDVGVGWSKKYVLEQPKKGLLKINQWESIRHS